MFSRNSGPTINLSRRNLMQASVGLGLGNLIAQRASPTQAQSTSGQAAQSGLAPTQLRVFCTGPAGSIPDIVARRITEQLATHYPQSASV
jgi:hypothetical protein